MRVPITVPDLRSGKEPIRISGWLIDEGDLVLMGDLVVELLIPGLTIDIVADSTGRLVEITKSVDSPVHVGDVLGWLETSNENQG
jgi:pyruvate/2-oxoglutarate dehydrogenase complex dihydrolipoamide acyltransferase (E2) component